MSVDRADSAGGAASGWRYRLLLLLAAAAVMWERLWPRLWPAVCVLGVFLSFALLDVLPRLPDWLHAVVLGGVVLALLGALVWARPAFRLASRSEARARLERDNALVHQPLLALEDRLAAGRDDLLAEALWRRHRQRMADLVGRLRVRWPHAEMSRHEPWGIRAGVLILLVLGLAAGHSEPGARLVRALDPGVRVGGQPAAVEVWITPPAYTGLAPLFVSSGSSSGVAPVAAEASAPLLVPAGSALLARVTGPRRSPDLALADRTTAFEALGQGSGTPAWRAETVVTDGDRIVVRSGRREVASWPISVVPDSPPQLAFEENPAEQGNGLLSLSWRASDDYGVVEVSAVMEAAAGDAVPTGETQEPLRVSLPLAGPPAAETAGESVQDLAEHPLAGLPVRIRLDAKDAAGQIGSSDTIEAVLPEREFTHPVAQRLVLLRKRLLPPSADRAGVAGALREIATQPDTFGRDVVVSLSLAVAEARLRLDQRAEAAPSVRDMLWQTALRLEQGDVPLAERQLEEARQRLAEALQRDAPAEEIERLMDALQEALDRYLAAAANELARRGITGGPLDPQAQMLRSDDLREMIETARQFIRSGGREGAMQMLADLQRMLDGIRSGLRNGVSGDLAEAQAMMQALRELSGRQQQLLDDTFQRLREQRAQQERARRPSPSWQAPSRDFSSGMPAPSPGGGAASQDPSGTPPPRQQGGEKGAGAAAEQQALRRDLGDLMLRLNAMLGNVPQPLVDADRAMKGAVDALGQSRLGDTLSNQTNALDALERAAQSAGQALAERLGGGVAIGGEGAGSGDIFGRAPGGRRGFATGTLKIPDSGNLQRSQEILDELRRRAAERSRPVDELDYIQRLLRRF